MDKSMSDMNIQIGKAAGAIYHELENGERNLTKLKNHLIENGFDAQISTMSIGWLAREGKLDVSKIGKKWSIKLK